MLLQMKPPYCYVHRQIVLPRNLIFKSKHQFSHHRRSLGPRQTDEGMAIDKRGPSNEYLVSISFSPNYKNVFRNNRFRQIERNVFLCRSWYENDCLIHVLCALSQLWDLHSGAVLLDHSGHSPLTLTHLIHEYHDDIPWNSVPSRGLRGTTLVAKY